MFLGTQPSPEIASGLCPDRARRATSMEAKKILEAHTSEELSGWKTEPNNMAIRNFLTEEEKRAKAAREAKKKEQEFIDWCTLRGMTVLPAPPPPPEPQTAAEKDAQGGDDELVECIRRGLPPPPPEVSASLAQRYHRRKHSRKSKESV